MISASMRSLKACPADETCLARGAAQQCHERETLTFSMCASN